MSHTQVQTVKQSKLVNGSPIYYGWIILGVGTLGVIMTSPGQTYSVSVFLEYFIQDLGISRSLVSTLYTVGTLTGSFALPLVGRQLDKRGPRLMMTGVAFLFGLACIYMGFIFNAFMLSLGFISIRMLGQGSLSLISTHVINQWWVKRRGTMMGISGLTASLLGLGGFPLLINWLIPIYGWRTTYGILGVMLLVIMVPIAFGLVRNQPEKFGLQPDGDGATDTNEDPNNSPVAEENWTLSEAVRTQIFWVLVLGASSISMLSTGLFFHMVSIFNDSNLPSSVAASVFVPIAITNALVNLGGGILIDRLPLRLLLGTGLFLQTTSLLMAPHLQGIPLAFLYGIILGATSGLIHIVNGVSWAKYYGRAYLGSITGVTQTVLVAGSALGPMPFGIARDLLGNYNQVLTLVAIIPFVLGIWSLSVKRPVKK